MARGAASVKRFAQCRRTILFGCAMTFTAADFFIFDVDKLAAFGIECVVAGAASLGLQRGLVCFVIKINSRSTEFSKYFLIRQSVNLFLCLCELKRRYGC